jgi:hypothetical protein
MTSLTEYILHGAKVTYEVIGLKCGVLFQSWNRRYNQICKWCKEENAYLLNLHTPEALGIESYSKD